MTNGGSNSSVVKCPPLNWNVGCSIGHCVNCRSDHWARAFTSAALARSKIQVSACCKWPITKKMWQIMQCHKNLGQINNFH